MAVSWPPALWSHAPDSLQHAHMLREQVQGLYQAGMEELQQELAAKEEAQAQLRQQAGLVDQLQAEVSALGAQKEQLLADLAQLADAASMVRPGPAGAGCHVCAAGLEWGSPSHL